MINCTRRKKVLSEKDFRENVQKEIRRLLALQNNPITEGRVSGLYLALSFIEESKV